MSSLHKTEGSKPTTAKFPRYSVRMLLRTMAVLALGYMLLVAYLHYQSEADIQDPDVQRLFGGPSGMTTLKYVDRIEASLIDDPAVSKNGVAGLLRYPIRNGPISISSSDAKALKRALLDRNSYAWTMQTDCKPAYGLRIDFIREDHQVSVLFCFECDNLMTYLDGKFVDVKDFGPAVHQTIGQILRTRFPEDPKIQSLF